MRTLALLANLLCSISAFAQWNNNDNTNTTSSNVSIGTSPINTNSKLFVFEGSNVKSTPVVISGNFAAGTSAFHHTFLTFAATGYISNDATTETTGEYSKNWHIGIASGTQYFNDSYFAIYNKGMRRLAIGANGNIGIGTSPDAKLSLRTSTASQGLIISNCDNSGIQSYFGFTTADQPRIGLASESYLNTYNDGKWNFNSASSNGGSTLPMSFNTDGVSRFYIKADGNIGIGTNNPGARLEINHAGGQLKLSGGSVAGGVWTNSYDVLYLADWNTGNKGLNVNMTSGKVAIGTTDMPGSHLLYVNGSIVTTEVNVKFKTAWPDYVFENGYKLPSLSELEQYIKTNKHLPDVPTAAEVKENGLSVGEMNAILLKKVEELTMYVIELKKENEEIKRIINK